MPSIFQLEGPNLGGSSIGSARLGLGLGRVSGLAPWLIAGVGLVFGAIAARRLFQGRALRGPEMIPVIAKESRSPEEYARRIEAWSASEAQPPSIAKLARAYRRGSPSRVARLIREAREERLEKRERLWSKMARGLRGQDLTDRQREALRFAIDHKGFVSVGVGSKWGRMNEHPTLKALAKRGYLEFYGKSKLGGGYAYDRYQYRITEAGRAALG